jgi:hypothetical protein
MPASPMAAQKLPNRQAQTLDEQADGDKVHVGDRVLKAGGHKGGDGEDDGQDLVGGGPRRGTQPHRQADQGVAHDAQEDGLDKVQAGLGIGDVQGREAERPAGEGVLRLKNMTTAVSDRADKVAGVHDHPVAQQRASVTRPLWQRP